MNPLIQSLTEGQLRTDIPAFQPGDTVVFTQKLSKEAANVSKFSKVW